MKIINPNIKGIIFHIPEGYESIEEFIEAVGRTCYKSEDKITYGSANDFVERLNAKGHHAMLEHAIATVRIEADRGLTHELVRHRLASYAQESTRWCNYSKGKFQRQITVIQQPGMTPEQEQIWRQAMLTAETYYMTLIDTGVPAEIARSVLPIGLKSEIVITANLREWMHIFRLRCSPAAHPIIRGIMWEALRFFSQKVPSIFQPFVDELEADSEYE
jgi:thymidylate synthase (FAD)